MKLLNKTLFLMLCTIIPAVSTAGQKVVIDVKVPLVETANLAPAQAGTTVYLMKSEWATVSEINEDVAVWMKDYERKKNFLGQQVVSLTLEVREPSSIRTGNLIKKQTITVRYRMNASETMRYEQDFLNELNNLSQELQIEAYFLGVKIESVLKGILN